MRDIDRKVWQFQDAAETEMRAWQVNVWPRYAAVAVRMGALQATDNPDYAACNDAKVRFEQEQFRDEAEAQRYVRLVSIEAGLKAIGAI